MNLSTYPSAYRPRLPSEEELRQEVMELIDRCPNAPLLIQSILKIPCPYHRENVAQTANKIWHELEKEYDERTGYFDMDGLWILSWINVDSEMRQIVRKARNQQAEWEINHPSNTPEPKKNITINTTTMPMIINKQEGTIYNHCTIYNGVSPHSTHNAEDVTVSNEPTTACETAPDMDAFTQLLTIPYRKRKEDCRHMLELLTQPHRNKKDRARMALALYQSGNVALQRENITTFSQWWKICCNTLQWEGADSCYKESQLTHNDVTRQIQLYL